MGNCVAHILARWTRESLPYQVFMEDVPLDVSCVYNYDLHLI